MTELHEKYSTALWDTAMKFNEFQGEHFSGHEFKLMIAKLIFKEYKKHLHCYTQEVLRLVLNGTLDKSSLNEALRYGQQIDRMKLAIKSIKNDMKEEIVASTKSSRHSSSMASRHSSPRSYSSSLVAYPRQ